jgi:hypothetical protein
VCGAEKGNGMMSNIVGCISCTIQAVCKAHPTFAGLKNPLLILSLSFSLLASPLPAIAALTAQEIIALAQQQLTVPSEFVLGEIKVYRGERLNRSYSFVLGRLWEQATQTEYVRIDFKTAINSGPDSSLYSDHRYLLKRTAQALPTQWLYLPTLRRVRITPYRPDDPLLQSDYLFYDLTAILDFADYHYRFVDANEQAPVIEGEPRAALVPYQRTIFTLERRGGTYIVSGVRYLSQGKERQVRFSGFSEIAPGRYRPQQMVVTIEGGRTEVTFHHWTVGSTSESQLFTPAHLETQTLTLPTDAEEK